jgi:hypothetical protein
MKSVLQKLIRSSEAILKRLFPSKEERKVKQLIKAGDRLYKSIVVKLEAKKDSSSHVYGSKHLLHRRLKQYQRLQMKGSRYAKVAAIMKLQKEWRKFQRDKGRVVQLTIDN